VPMAGDLRSPTGYTGVIAEAELPARFTFSQVRTPQIEWSGGSNRRPSARLRISRHRHGHAIYMAAVTQIRNRRSDGRAYYDKKRAEGKTGEEALRALKRRVSDAIYRQLQADARRTPPARAAGPGGKRGTSLHPARPAHTPSTSSSDRPLPSPLPHYAPPASDHLPLEPRPARVLDHKEGLVRYSIVDVGKGVT
jgi:transposase